MFPPFNMNSVRGPLLFFFQLTLEVVFRLGVVRAHDGRGLPPDHDQDPHPGLGLPLKQLAQGQPGQLALALGSQVGVVVAPAMYVQEKFFVVEIIHLSERNVGDIVECIH